MNRKILDEVLEEISLPAGEEKGLKKEADEIVKKINLQSKKVKAQIGGSLAKSTMVKKDVQDVDIFVQFDDEKSIGGLGGVLKKAKLNAEVVHGSRDYFKIKNKNIIFEIIPVVKFTQPENANNVTDFSLLHVNYVKKQIAKNPKLANEIKLAKTFCHAQEVYGAESYISGFSGYALEVLVISFGSFVNFLRQVQKDKNRVLDPARHFRNSREIMNELNPSKLVSPLILVDPTYKYRNVTAALSSTTFEKFLSSAKKFLKKPSRDFFVAEKFSVENFKKGLKKDESFLEFDLETDRQEGDIAGTKMKKFSDFLIRALGDKQQRIVKSKFIYFGGKVAKFYLILKLKNKIELSGPPVSMKEAVKNFRRVHKKAKRVRGTWVSEKDFELEEFLNGLEKVGEEMGVGFLKV